MNILAKSKSNTRAITIQKVKFMWTIQRTCSCQSKSVAPRGINMLSNSGCLEVTISKSDWNFMQFVFHYTSDLIAFTFSLITLGLGFSHNAILIIHHLCFDHNKGEDLTHYGSTVFEAREASPLNIISYGKYSSYQIHYTPIRPIKICIISFACSQWSLSDVWRQLFLWPKWRDESVKYQSHVVANN